MDRREYGDVLDDMRPYEKLARNGSIAGVMTAHVVYSEMDERPASFSEFWIVHELRERLGFDGAVFSDDLSMKATRDWGSMAERSALALSAGCDMVIICNDRPRAQRAVHRPVIVLGLPGPSDTMDVLDGFGPDAPGLVPGQDDATDRLLLEGTPGADVVTISETARCTSASSVIARLTATSQARRTSMPPATSCAA